MKKIKLLFGFLHVFFEFLVQISGCDFGLLVSLWASAGLASGASALSFLSSRSAWSASSSLTGKSGLKGSRGGTAAGFCHDLQVQWSAINLDAGEVLLDAADCVGVSMKFGCANGTAVGIVMKGHFGQTILFEEGLERVM